MPKTITIHLIDHNTSDGNFADFVDALCSTSIAGVDCEGIDFSEDYGKVSLILDVVGLAKRAHLLSDESKKRAVEQESQQSAGTSTKQQAMLLVEVPGGDQLAVPLEQVAQLEKVPCSMIEHVGTQDAIQYRDGILPLVNLAQLLPEQTAGQTNLGIADAKNLAVIVVSTTSHRLESR